ncbi:hypothetical protein Bbelb_132850 [Branchiostoma belcheri]|nr:hypothetical protein Bbelb_132850 [Branchiostoma belcheri]
MTFLGVVMILLATCLPGIISHNWCVTQRGDYTRYTDRHPGFTLVHTGCRDLDMNIDTNGTSLLIGCTILESVPGVKCCTPSDLVHLVVFRTRIRAKALGMN